MDRKRPPDGVSGVPLGAERRQDNGKLTATVNYEWHAIPGWRLIPEWAGYVMSAEPEVRILARPLQGGRRAA